MSTSASSILLIDDDPDVLLSARLLLKSHFDRIHTLEDPAKLLDMLQQETFDVLLLDMNFTRNATCGKEGFDWLTKILDVDPDMAVILITAYGDVEMAVRAIKQGATDFILKPWENERLVTTVTTAIKLRRSKDEISRLRERQRQMSGDIDSRFHHMIGRSKAMQRVFDTISKVAATDANVLILGANGTGKELVARALHRGSLRAADVFISVDMGAIPDNLFENELFGHAKGAYTGAGDRKLGRMELASGGTLFMDEVGNLPLPLQGKLLRVLEERHLTPLGDNKPRSIDIRLLCATNTATHDLVATGKFRPDFLYRINTVEIQLPPLTQRGEDIIMLADFFMRNYARRYQKPELSLTKAAQTELLSYRWPGNVRELRHTMERAVILSEGDVIDVADLRLPETFDCQPTLAPDNLAHSEKQTIKRVLAQSDGNISQAAKVLGLTRAALYRRLQRHDL
ncbi:sigma-54 dependent transcriptional regulator [uncultured Desulfosarcina sp.]|uniref:sigma-54-dependent transcriptional regulator n=1 Tax=uncultured Desulfosarcina sp. TaxID=218289 RepID=UPI0029C8C5ED|nr:sigma-54 dependent transcriptional regulator [uncultured Desulfosarcina sp.]